MLMSFRVGTDDLDKARQFYDATFAAIGGPSSMTPPGAPMLVYKDSTGVMFLVGPAADGQPATHANGGTILLSAENDEQISAWHAAGIANGGTCDGPPGPRPRVGGKIGAYLRDPDGNKFGCYTGNLFAG